MVHAYLFVFKYQASTIFQDSQSAEIGKTGHGRPWQETALKIEQDAESSFNSTWDLGRERGFALEWTATHQPGILPSQSELDEWGFDRTAITTLIEHFRSKVASGESRDVESYSVCCLCN